MGKHTLITFGKPKYAEQIVAILPDGSGAGLKLFDAVDLFVEDDNFSTRQAFFESGAAKTFATEFVAQFNSHAALTEAVRVLSEALENALPFIERTAPFAQANDALIQAKELLK